MEMLTNASYFVTVPLGVTTSGRTHFNDKFVLILQDRGGAWNTAPFGILSNHDIPVSYSWLGENVVTIVESGAEQFAAQGRDIRLLADQGLIDACPFDLTDQDQTNESVAAEDEFAVVRSMPLGKDFDAVPRQSLHVTDRHDWQADQFHGVDHDLVSVGTSINTSANFTDPGTLDTHTAAWNWGDGATSAGTISEAGGNGTASHSHSYSTPGVYTLRLTVTDKATFGFVSKYQKGANVPTGNTEFQFKVANLNFKSTSYDWLVIAGTKAQYKGAGTINGAGNYGFMLTARDGTPDKFRIKIWDKDNGDTIIYDNLMSGADDADPTTALGGGSIVIHK